MPKMKGIYKTIKLFKLFNLIIHMDKRYFCVAIARLPKKFKKVEAPTIGFTIFKGKLNSLFDLIWIKEVKKT